MGEPRAQGKRYTEDENEIIRRLFPEMGVAGVQIYLPHRPVQSIQKQAGRLDVFKRGAYTKAAWKPRVVPSSLHPSWPAIPGQLRGAL